MLPKIRLIVAVAGLVMAIMIPSTFAADFPAKDITLICPWSAGGGTDTLARALVKRRNSASVISCSALTLPP